MRIAEVVLCVYQDCKYLLSLLACLEWTSFNEV